MKYGVNTPHNVWEFVSETASARAGFAQSIVDTVKATATEMKRKIGLSNEKPLGDPPSNASIHGPAGKMQHTTPGFEGGPAASRENAEAQYDEMIKEAKPNFPEGEKSINDQFPDQAEVARLQNKGGDVKLDKNLHEMGP